MQCQMILTALIGVRPPGQGRGGVSCVFQDRLGVPAAHPVGWAADCLADSLARSRLGFLPWTRRDLNPRPPACKAGALPTELRARTGVRTRARWIRLHETSTYKNGEPGRSRIVPGGPGGR